MRVGEVVVDMWALEKSRRTCGKGQNGGWPEEGIKMLIKAGVRVHETEDFIGPFHRRTKGLKFKMADEKAADT
ncbi:hypothetical protein RUM44_007731 [Polyplax serrata]|uniref:Uncharacterized protein n=1 Tax=Polyplax serrata TaxID=468196 RepID=A0ABR1BAE1_POLSC